MSRPLRNLAAGALYHVIARGHARMTLYHDDADRWRFLGMFETVVERYRIELSGLLRDVQLLSPGSALGHAVPEQYLRAVVEPAACAGGHLLQMPIALAEKVRTPAWTSLRGAARGPPRGEPFAGDALAPWGRHRPAQRRESRPPELVWSNVLRIYDRDAALAWLFGVNPRLGDRRPVD
jgi:hypothetical protein